MMTGASSEASVLVYIIIMQHCVQNACVFNVYTCTCIYNHNHVHDIYSTFTCTCTCRVIYTVHVYIIHVQSCIYVHVYILDSNIT